VRFKNISSVDLHCLTDRTSEVYWPVKPLKDGETIVGLIVERANPDLTLSSMLSSSASKIKPTYNTGDDELYMDVFTLSK
jgi:hypothetical protein